MRRAARIDATQEEIVICLRLIGVSVQRDIELDVPARKK